MTIANRLSARLPIPADELTSDGMTGLLSAIERFEPGRGNLFCTFAGQWVEGSILDAVRERDRDVGRTARNRQRVEAEAVAQFRTQNGRLPSEIELDGLLPPMTPMVRSNWREDVRRASPTSLDVARTDPDGREVMQRDLLAVAGPGHEVGVDDRDEIEAMMKGLPPTVAASILDMVTHPHDSLQVSVAERRGISTSAVQQHVVIAREHFAAYKAGHRIRVPESVVEKPPSVVRLPDVHVRPVTVRAGASREPIVGTAQIARLWRRPPVVASKVTVHERDARPARVIEQKPTVQRRTTFEAVPADMLLILSPRERQVLELRASGMTSQQVADRIGRGLANVRALSKLARKRIDNALAARAAGLPVESFASSRRSLPQSRHPLIILLISFRPPQSSHRAEPIGAESFPRLTERQRQVASLRAAGLSHSAIAGRLGIRRSTSIVTLKDARKRLRTIAEGATRA